MPATGDEEPATDGECGRVAEPATEMTDHAHLPAGRVDALDGVSLATCESSFRSCQFTADYVDVAAHRGNRGLSASPERPAV